MLEYALRWNNRTGEVVVETFSELLHNVGEHGMNDAGTRCHAIMMPHRIGSCLDMVIVPRQLSCCLTYPLGPSRSRGSISSSHTPSKGSGRVRHHRSCFVSDGNEPRFHLRADRTHVPAMAAAVSRVFPSTSFCLNSLTCRSSIKIRHGGAGRFYSFQTGKNSQHERHSLLSSITSSSTNTRKARQENARKRGSRSSSIG